MKGEFEKNVFKKKLTTIPPNDPTLPDNLQSIPESSYYNKAYNELALKYHNKFRSLHQADSLVFDGTLAEGAQAFAAQLNKAGKLSYSTPAASADAPPNSGENVVMDSNHNWLLTTGAAFDSWYREGI